jgi:predicted nucleic acid-binding protein
LERLDAFVSATAGRYLPLSDEALRLAANLWAQSRREGRPAADATALDIDVLLAAQVLSFGADPLETIVVTTNPKHLSPFVPARGWNEIAAD